MNIFQIENIQDGVVRLRPMVEGDADLIMTASFSDIPDWTFIPRSLDEEASRDWIRRGVKVRDTGLAIRFVIEIEGQSAGTVGAQHPYVHDLGIVETFYFILPEFRRRGLATAALKLLDQWVQSVTPELRRLQLHVIVGHPGSRRVAEAAGYVFEGVAVNQIPSVNGFGARDARVYSRPIATGEQSGVGGVLA